MSVYFSFTGGWLTSSNISATIEPNRRTLVVLCHGINMQLAENVVQTHTVNILCKYSFKPLSADKNCV